MVDLKGQYQKIKFEIDEAVLNCIESAQFIQGPQVKLFENELAAYLGAQQVIACANGTDALQIALMALGLQPGDEVIVPTFTYVATAEVIGLLKLTPVMVDVDPDTFNVTADIIEKAITTRTKAIVPVHLFGQCADMEPIMALAKKHGLWVIEDNAQAIGADYTFASGEKKKAGTIGHIGTTSFFPAKNLGCYGDGGAIMTNDDDLAKKIRMVANHGQSKKYYHDVLGVNSRLDSIQAAILSVKLPHLNSYCAARQAVAEAYDAAFRDLPGVTTPVREPKSTHVFHQYTLKVPAEKRAGIIAYLSENGVPSMIYYPVPLYKQEAFKPFWGERADLPVTEQLCQTVMSLPIHTEMDEALLQHIAQAFKNALKIELQSPRYSRH
ncbi:MAG: DegT/DnrJ/EryC1/StrS family aminotransferase [Saprospiraceae bacterium]|nr:DegT/DnrJ/EryC1/StrS family aminotransferase [Saprospiraceae bacterium]